MGACRPLLRRALDRPRRAARLEGRRGEALTGGLAGLAKQRKVTVVSGTGRFLAPNQVTGQWRRYVATTISFEQAIIAAGSEPVTLPFIPHDDPRVIDSTGALELNGMPQRLLVIGGGIIGLEMATVYHALGAKVTVVELMDQIIPGADQDIVTPLMKRIEKRYDAIYLKTKVDEGGGGAGRADGAFRRRRRHPRARSSTAILVAVGRRPNGAAIGAEEAGVVVDHARLHPSRQADAHQCAEHLCHRRHRRAADAGAQGGA